MAIAGLVLAASHSPCMPIAVACPHGAETIRQWRCRICCVTAPFCIARHTAERPLQSSFASCHPTAPPIELDFLPALNCCCVQELDWSEKQWVEACGQIDKLDKFFPLSSLALNKAKDAQMAAVARGQPHAIPAVSLLTAGLWQHLPASSSLLMSCIWCLHACCDSNHAGLRPL